MPCGAGQVGSFMMSRYMAEQWKRERCGMVHVLWKEVKAVRSRLLRGGILVPPLVGHGDIRAWADAKGHVWVHGTATARVCVAIHESFCHQRPQGC